MTHRPPQLSSFSPFQRLGARPRMLLLALLPDAWQTALLVQPLAGLMDIPARLYFGQLRGADALLGLALQCFWIALLVATGRWLLVRTMRRLQVQGG